MSDDPDVADFYDDDYEEQEQEPKKKDKEQPLMNEAFEFCGGEYCASITTIKEEDVPDNIVLHMENGETISKYMPEPTYITPVVLIPYQHSMVLTFAVYLKFNQGRAAFDIAPINLCKLMTAKKPTVAPFKLDGRDRMAQSQTFKLLGAVLRGASMKGKAQVMFARIISQPFANTIEVVHGVNVCGEAFCGNIAAVISNGAPNIPLGDFTLSNAHPPFGMIFSSSAGSDEGMPKLFFDQAKSYIPGAYGTEQRYDVNKKMFRVPCQSLYSAAVAISCRLPGSKSDNMFPFENTASGSEFIIDQKRRRIAEGVIADMYKLAPNSDLSKTGFQFEVLACDTTPDDDNELAFIAMLELTVSMMVIHRAPKGSTFSINLGDPEF